MTIHTDHPFATPDPDRSPVRRLRGRLPSAVTVVTTPNGPPHGPARRPVGLTLSSVLVVEPEFLVLVVNDLSDLADALDVGTGLSLSVLEAEDVPVAEVFAGLAPAPGGMFTVGDWTDAPSGPHLAGRTWAAATVTEARELGWSKVITARIDHVEFGAGDAVSHVRGQYR